MLSFESRLSILCQLTGKKQEIIQLLKEQVDKKYFPSSLYEIVAHLFKHRFIDVIINFNFDELLDNAIEDELGERTYLRVVHDSDIIEFKNICDNNRLKTPLYIKPHGSVSSPSSMLFTREQYIKDLSTDMKDFLTKIFQGKVGDDENNGIKRFNFLIAGFALESTEFNELLFTEICDSDLKTINYFIFDYDTSKVGNKIIHEYGERKKRPIEKDSIIPFDCVEKTLASHFYKIYEDIQSLFDIPYKPQKPLRHLLLLEFFPESVTQNFDCKKNYNEFVKYIEKRIKFNLLYDLLKFNGCFSTNVSIGSRAGKYYQLLLKIKHEHNELYDKNLISILDESLNIIEDGKRELIRISDVGYLYKPFQQLRIMKLIEEKVIKPTDFSELPYDEEKEK
ncbi:MAG: SIR2 family protein [Bacteroidetes bacterium]|nr:SIR2 family protein [Bacteroidota bacterium]